MTFGNIDDILFLGFRVKWRNAEIPILVLSACYAKNTESTEVLQHEIEVVVYEMSRFIYAYEPESSRLYGCSTTSPIHPKVFKANDLLFFLPKIWS